VIWKLLLDEDFIEAYKNGIVVNCFNRINRRIYPRIFTYSADYPEKYIFWEYMLTRYSSV